jgi:hypothetical protein
MERIERHLGPLRLTASLCRLLANLTLVVTLTYLFTRHAGWHTSGVALAMLSAAVL